MLQGECSRHPHYRAGSCFPTPWQTCGRWLRPVPFLTPKKLSCFRLLLPPISCPASGAGEMWKPSTGELGLHMPPSQSTEGEDGAQERDPQKVDGPDFLGTDGTVENGNTSGIGGETLLGKGKSSGRSTGGIPLWAAARAGESLPPKLLTLVIIHKEGKVLLGMKKRGFGKGLYNGFGGKVEKGETIDEAAARELNEESGVTPLDMTKRGILTFHFDNDPKPWEVHVYHVSEIVGDPYETEEMAPRWFTVSEIPYEKMWEDNILWYPELLQGRHFEGSFYFENTTTFVAHSLRVNSTW